MKKVLWEKAKSSQKPRKSISLGRLKKIDRKKSLTKLAKNKLKSNQS